VDEPDDHMDEILAQWREERPDLNVTPLGLCGRLFRIVHLVDDALAKGLAPYGLQPGWFDLLAALRRAGAPYELNPTRLVRATLIPSSGTPPSRSTSRREVDCRLRGLRRLRRLRSRGRVDRRDRLRDTRASRSPS
jgi:hypothetical protein